MRPPSRSQSALRYPLNDILGTQANVRVLRVMLLSDIPIGVSELARLAQLQASGVARVVTRLEDLGVIEAVGRRTRNRQYRRAARFALGGSLVRLFHDEHQRGHTVTQEIREAIRHGAPGARAAWIEGPVASGTDRPEDAITVTVLTDPATVDRVRHGVWQRLIPVQANHDVVAELRIMTQADLETADRQRLAELEHVLPLVGPPPQELIRVAGAARGIAETPRKGHQRLDLRSREMARVVADRIGRDPSIVENARRFIEQRLLSVSPGERLELEEWSHILSTMSIPRLRRFLVQDSARATRLRQSSPFLQALSWEERQALMESAAKPR